MLRLNSRVSLALPIALIIIVFQNCGEFQPIEGSSPLSSINDSISNQKVWSLEQPIQGANLRSVFDVSGTCPAGETAQLKIDGRDINHQVFCIDGRFSQPIDVTGDDGAFRLVLSMGESQQPFATRELIKDSQAPSLQLTQALPEFTNSDTLNLVLQCEPSAILEVKGSLTAQRTQTCTDGEISINAQLTDGDEAKTIEIIATDKAGNITQLTHNVFVDTKAPILTIAQPVKDAVVTRSFDVSGSCEDGLMVQATGSSLETAVQTICSDSTYRLSLQAKSGLQTASFSVQSSDLSNNSIELGHSVRIDSTIPKATLSFVGDSVSDQPQRTISISFDRPVTGLTLSDFIVTGATLQNLSGTGTTYQLSLQFNQTGEASLTLPSDRAVDVSSGKGNSSSNQLSLAYYTARPAGELVLSYIDQNFDINHREAVLQEVSIVQDFYSLPVYMNHAVPVETSGRLRVRCYSGKEPTRDIDFKIAKGQKQVNVQIPIHKSPYYFGVRPCDIFLYPEEGVGNARQVRVRLNVIDNKKPPTFTISMPQTTVTEGQSIPVTFRLSAPVSRNLLFSFFLMNGDGPIKFESGVRLTMEQTEVTGQLFPDIDGYFEIDESVTLQFRASDRSILAENGQNERVVTIKNVDPAPIARLITTQTQMYEDNVPFIDMIIEGRTRVIPVIKVTTVDGTAKGGDCTQGADFEALDKAPMDVQSGGTSGGIPNYRPLIAWTPCHDFIDEENESFQLDFSASQYVQKITDTVTINLIDDDSPVLGITSVMLKPLAKHLSRYWSVAANRSAAVVATDGISLIANGGEHLFSSSQPHTEEFSYYKVTETGLTWVNNFELAPPADVPWEDIRYSEAQGFIEGNQLILHLNSRDLRNYIFSFEKVGDQWVQKQVLSEAASLCSRGSAFKFPNLVIVCRDTLLHYHFSDNKWQLANNIPRSDAGAPTIVNNQLILPLHRRVLTYDFNGAQLTASATIPRPPIHPKKPVRIYEAAAFGDRMVIYFSFEDLPGPEQRRYFGVYKSINGVWTLQKITRRDGLFIPDIMKLDGDRLFFAWTDNYDRRDHTNFISDPFSSNNAELIRLLPDGSIDSQEITMPIVGATAYGIMPFHGDAFFEGNKIIFSSGVYMKLRE